MNKEKTTRIDLNFSDELADIRKKRLENGNDKKKISDRKLTALIPKHKNWGSIKKEMINLNQNTIKDILRENGT